MFEQGPRRGLEIGGILLGRVETKENLTTFWVDGFRPVESEHRWGPSYLLSDPDFARLREEMERCGSRCIGIYRSQTRARQLALDVSDVKVFGQCFHPGNALFLMLAPALGKAAFFRRADADRKCVREFGLPLPGTIGPRRDPSPRRYRLHDRPTRSLPAPPAEVPAKLAAKAKTKSWYSAALIAILLLGAGASGLAGLLAHRAQQGLPGPKVVELKVQPLGSSLHVRWDPNSPALRGANRVVLHVQDGDYRSDRDLAASEIRSGSTVYDSRSEEVFLRIDAYATAPSAIGSVRVISSSRRTNAVPTLNPGHSAANLPPAAAKVAPPLSTSVKDGNPTKAWLGMSLRNVTRDVALAFHLPQPSGLLVTKVDAWSPAGTSGLESGDIILALDAQRIADTQELQLKIRQMTPGRAATVSVFRDGAIHQIEVPVGDAPGRVAQSAVVAAQR